MSLTGPGPNKARSILIAHPGSELYGSDRVTLASAEYLIERGWRVTVTVPLRGPLCDALEAVGATVVVLPFPVLRKSAMTPTGAAALLRNCLAAFVPAVRLIRRVRPSVVYVATVTLPFWILVGRLCRVRVLCHLHEAEVGAHPVLRKVLAAPTVLANGVIANSRFTLGSLKAELPRTRFNEFVIRNPISPPTSPSARPRSSLDPPVRILFVGRLSPRKGPQIAIEALSTLVSGGIDCQLSLLGAVYEGYEWFETDLRSQIKDLDLEERVTFLGFHQDVWPFLDGCDITVVPSLDPEGFGNTAVEAVMAQRPIVTVDSGGLVEAVEGFACAVLTAPGSAPHLAAAIKTIADQWDDFAGHAVADARVATARHSTESYRDALQRAVQVTLGVTTKDLHHDNNTSATGSD